MAYLKDFRARIQEHDYPGFLKIWEEYCYGDQPEADEIIAVLEEMKTSELCKTFGVHVERVIPLWRELTDREEAYNVLRLVLDLQTSQSETLADLALEHLTERFGEDPLFAEKLRLVGLRNKEIFQGAIRNFELLTHLKPQNFVFHTAGWGTGEITDVSLIREEVSIEFEYVVGIQHFSFSKAFKTLLPLSNDHFCSRRFGWPDELETEAKKDPVSLIHLLLRDLGPKTTAEIKEELCDLVIQSSDWNRWWQNARAKIKKDTKIESPKDLKDPFRLREEEVSHEILFHKALEARPETNATIQMTYSFLRDFPESLKNEEFKVSLKGKLLQFLEQPILADFQKLSLLFLLEDIKVPKVSSQIHEEIKALENPMETIQKMSILPFQKRTLTKIKRLRADWQETFLELLFQVDQNMLRDFLFQELIGPKTQEALRKKMASLLVHPLSFAEVFVWYFQKLTDPKASIAIVKPGDQNRFFEGLLVLLDHLTKKEGSRDLAKKIVQMIIGNRYKLVRDMLAHTSLEEAQEIVLLSTKCQSFSDHDVKIFHSLAEVVHPSLSALRKKGMEEEEPSPILWTTQEGYQKAKDRLEKIATVETVQNAKEIEEARSHGDLRENAEFKAAIEKKSRLQTEIKMISGQLDQARILIREDVDPSKAGVGTKIHCQNSKGETTRFTLLGPWDADPEKHILSFQSKLAQAMTDKTVAERFTFQGEEYTITAIDNYFDQKD